MFWPWRQTSRYRQFLGWFAWFVMAYSLATIFTNIPGLQWVVLAWLPFLLVEVIRDWRWTNQIRRESAELAAFDPREPLSDLSPELQENIQISWAKKVLREKD